MTETTSLLIEIFCEELPARMQRGGLSQFKQFVLEGLQAEGLDPGVVHEGVTPRRLALGFDTIPTQTEGGLEERRGPRVGAPEGAVAGFAKGAGVNASELIKKDTPKGEFWVAEIRKEAKPLELILKSIVPEALDKIHWPKAMRWADGKATWARPIQKITVILGGELIEIPTDYVQTINAKTFEGHRFMGQGSFTATTFHDYETKLKENFVILDPDTRKEMIRTQAQDIAKAHHLSLIEDENLLEELTGLVEYPVCYLANIDHEMMSLPREVLITTLKVHQKYLCLETADGKLAPHFIIISNMKSSDGGKTIIQGNERVARARLSDGRFGYDHDCSRSMDDFREDLSGLIFYTGLGTMAGKAERLEKLCTEFAPLFQTDAEQAALAGRYAKADLVSEMVGEFPELQGIMGRYYLQDTNPEVAIAVGEHYRPSGPNDALPETTLGQVLSLADRLDTLVGFFGVGQKPTGSKDPYALRRACLGVIRILQNTHNMAIEDLIAKAVFVWSDAGISLPEKSNITSGLVSFFKDRLLVFWKEAGYQHDHIQSVLDRHLPLDIADAHACIKALKLFLGTDQGASLISVYRRAANIVSQAEEEGTAPKSGGYDPAQFVTSEEKSVHKGLTEFRTHDFTGNYDGLFKALLDLEAPLKGFFDNVTVQDKDTTLRENRLKLLTSIRSEFEGVLSFRKIEIK